MKFRFNKPTCQNIRKSLRKEWIETNGLGDYASSSLICCNTRKYHGLLVADLEQPVGKHVLLSTLEESLLVGDRELFFSCRKHPGVYYPRGHEYLHEMEIGEWPIFRYRLGEVTLCRELMLIPGRRLLIVRYEVRGAGPDTPPMSLRVKPLLAFRHADHLTHANPDLRPETFSAPSGFSVRPYPALPPLFMQAQGEAIFDALPDWYRTVEYLVEQERGFAYQEDLFQPGVFDIRLVPGKPVYLTASTEAIRTAHGQDVIGAIWRQEAERRLEKARSTETLEGHLAHEGEKCLIRRSGGEPAVVAGYHWFGSWGRDTLIALPGLTFYAGRPDTGADVLARMGAAARDGRIPNCFSADGNHAYNSVDASLWYVWAVQQMLRVLPDRKGFVREHCWPVIKAVIDAYGGGRVPLVSRDAEGFLSVGTPETQLTWMDATVDGRPVTPRHGQPVEISALWYNALAFADSLAKTFGEPEWRQAGLDGMRAVFAKRHWVHDEQNGDFLADVWREGDVDTRVRPNQLFAISLPYPVLEEEYYANVLSRVRRCLLTPYGLRTLAPSAPDYRSLYEGGPAQRDGAYHQGTVWPWLLGAYGEALLRTAWDVPGSTRELLRTLRPLFAQHLGDAGMGSVSEIFDGDPPHLPNGCIAQAWSVAECLRLLHLLREAAPEVYAEWEADARKGGD